MVFVFLLLPEGEYSGVRSPLRRSVSAYDVSSDVTNRFLGDELSALQSELGRSRSEDCLQEQGQQGQQGQGESSSEEEVEVTDGEEVIGDVTLEVKVRRFFGMRDGLERRKKTKKIIRKKKKSEETGEEGEEEETESEEVEVTDGEDVIGDVTLEVKVKRFFGMRDGLERRKRWKKIRRKKRGPGTDDVSGAEGDVTDDVTDDVGWADEFDLSDLGFGQCRSFSLGARRVSALTTLLVKASRGFRFRAGRDKGPQEPGKLLTPGDPSPMRIPKDLFWAWGPQNSGNLDLLGLQPSEGPRQLKEGPEPGG